MVNLNVLRKGTSGGERRVGKPLLISHGSMHVCKTNDDVPCIGVYTVLHISSYFKAISCPLLTRARKCGCTHANQEAGQGTPRVSACGQGRCRGVTTAWDQKPRSDRRSSTFQEATRANFLILSPTTFPFITTGVSDKCSWYRL